MEGSNKDVTYDGTNYYLYDAANRLCAVEVPGTPAQFFGYLYDGNGDRIAKGTLNGLSCNLASNGFSLTASYVVGKDGEQLDELHGSDPHTNVYAGGKLLATYSASQTYFAFSDWLGTKRVEIGPNCISQYASLAYGDELTEITPSGSTACSDATEHHYTGKERDQESGNDYFGARYYASIAGRFLSPDWSGNAEALPYAIYDDPQSLNLYAYVMNRPVTGIDADGHGCEYDGTCWIQGNITNAPQAADAASAIMGGGVVGDALVEAETGGGPAQQQSTDNSGNVVYKPGVPQASPDVSKMLSCTASCSDETLRVTSTSEAIPQHPAGKPHRIGEAADVTVKPGTAKRVLACAATCGAKFAQDEGAHPIPGHTTGPHIHLQTVPGKRGGRGDLPREIPEPRPSLRNDDDQ